MTCPGRARSSTSARASPACAAPRLPTDTVRSGATFPGPRRAAPVTALTARVWRPATMAWSTSLSVTPADLRASAKASRASGTYISSPKRSSHTWESISPGTRQRSRNSSLAAPRADELGHRAVGPAEERHPAVAGVALLGPAGQPGAEVGRPRPASGAPAPPRGPSAPCRRRSGGRRRSRRPRSRGRGRGRRARWWRWSCPGSPGAGVEKRRSWGAPGPGPGRAGRLRPPASWCPRRRRPRHGCPCPAPSPSTAAMAATLQPPVGQVGAP